MSAVVEALYIFDDQRKCILEHVYNGRPPKPQDLINRYTNYAAPQPSVLQLTELIPPTTAYSIRHSNLLFICTRSNDTQALAILEFLRKIVDIFEDFLGCPLLSSKIEENYEVVAQILAEVCDGGVICNTEPNALREAIEVSSGLGRLFTQVGIPSSSPSLGPSSSLSSNLKTASTAAAGPAIPWRKSNVRHTSNELYVDIVESLNIIFAPSGRPLSARSNGSIVFSAKISGVPDLLLTLTAPGGSSTDKSSGITRTMQLPAFHPCVRLARWKENPGELSFVPPDGRFMLAGYEVDLLPYSLNEDQPPSRTEQIFLPATVDLKTGLGQSGADFEARVTLSNNFPGVPNSSKSTAPGRSAAASAPFSFGSAQSGSSSTPTLEAVVISIPFPQDVRNVTDFRASRGDASFNLVTKTVEWKIPTKDGATVNGTAILSGTVTGGLSPTGDLDATNDESLTALDISKANSVAGYYNDAEVLNNASTVGGVPDSAPEMSKQKRVASSKKALMPRSIAVSFSVKGWLPSGIKVDGLMVDARKSKGLGEGVKPYKGVKYLTMCDDHIGSYDGSSAVTDLMTLLRLGAELPASGLRKLQQN